MTWNNDKPRPRRKPKPEITADSPTGRLLLALRAGEMTSAEITERFDHAKSVSALARAGLVESGLYGWRLTAAGRVACPLRNPLAATVLISPPLSLITPRTWQSPLHRPTPPRKLIKETEMPASKPVETIAQATARIAAANAAAEATNATAQAAAPAVAQDAASVVLGILASATGGLKRGVLIRRSGLQEGTVDSAISRLVKRGKAERAQYGVIRLVGSASAAAAVPAAPATTPATTPAATFQPPRKSAAPAAQPPESDANEVEFAVYSDGRLAIIDGDEIFVLKRDDTYRLPRFLGLFDVDVVAQSQAA